MNSSSQVRHSDIVSLHYLLKKVTSESWISVWLVHSHQEKPISENLSLRKLNMFFVDFLLERLIGRAFASPTFKWRLFSRNSDMVGDQNSLKCKNSMFCNVIMSSNRGMAIHKLNHDSVQNNEATVNKFSMSLPNELFKKYPLLYISKLH